MSKTDPEHQALLALWERRDDVLYKARLSALYHSKRERFLELADKLGKAVAVLGGSAALWKITSPDILAWLLIPVTVWSALSLVFAFSERAKRHAEMACKWRELIAQIEGKGMHPFTEENIDHWMDEALTLESLEPPALKRLVIECQNEIAVADNCPQAVHPQGFLSRGLMHLC